MKKKSTNMFELPPKCPALAGKITGIFGWRHTYQVHQRQKGIAHGNQYLYKSYSLNLPRARPGAGPTASTSGLLTGGGASSSTRERSSYHQHHHHQLAGSSGSCCATETPGGTPDCETNPDSWVVVHHLQSQSGILDPEDHISDVADDREEIIASYEDAGVGPEPGVQQGGGDGASGSSVGTGSPDIFQVGGPKGASGGVRASGASAGEPPPDDDVTVSVTVGGEGGVDASVMGVGGTGGSAAGGGGSSATAGGSSSCIEVSANEPGPLGLGLQVRRGSEPSLHQIGVTDQRSPLYNVNPNGHHQETSKRWSAAPVCRSDNDPPQQSDPQNGAVGVGGVGASSYHHHHHHQHHHLLSPEWNVPEEDPQHQQQQLGEQQAQQQQHDSLLPQAFNRSGRLSMQFLGAESTTGYRWMDAAEKAATAHHSQSSSPVAYQPYVPYMQQQQNQQQLHHSFHHSGARSGDGGRGAIGGNNGSFSSKSLPRESTRKEPLGQAKASVYDSLREKDSEMLLVVNETGGPLGLTAIPDKDRGGLLVQSVEPGSRAERGRLRRGDRILEINNIKLVGLSESSVQEHLKKSLASTELRLRVVRGTTRSGKAGGATGDQREHQFTAAPGRLVTGGSGSRYRRDNRVGQMMIEAEEKPTSAAKVATVSPTRKMPGAPSTASSLQVANTRKLGKRIEITLTKGDHGLGFSVTTRDNPAGGHCPIYIKNILPKGAAVEDGRLKPGDRLLEVEGIPMTGKSQTEVVSILRGTPHGATLKIVVSRQQELADVKEREIGFDVESEPKNTTVPKPPPPVLPKSSLKQSNSSNSLVSHHPPDGGGVGDDYRGGVSGSRSMQKLPSSASSPKTPTVQKKPLASILKSASTNQVADLLLQDTHVNGVDSGCGVGGGGGGASMTFTNGSTIAGSGGGSLSGAAWKNREILTLHIPVHDTEKAGLGVSVKGKTGSGNSSSSGGSGSNTSRTDGDLGIFVKSVLHGGAASRDGRLKMNDQLLSVNGVSLLGQSNAEAMETLRRAMLQQSGGSYPGKIILTVARRIGRPVSTGELLETIDSRPAAPSVAVAANGDLHQHTGNGGSGNAANAGTTVIYLSPDKQQHRPQDNGEPKLQQNKRYSNPVLDRLTGGSGNGTVSNSAGNTVSTLLPMLMTGSVDVLSAGGGSHYSHIGGSNSSSTNSMAHSNLQQQHGQNQRASGLRSTGSRGPSSVQQTPPAHGLRNESYYMATGEHWNTTSSATSLNGSNAVLIEEDPEPTSPTFHLVRPSEVGAAGGVAGVVLGNGNTSTPNGADTTYASQLSLETNPPPSDAFSRDAIGRRSMSEKHHAAMDARETGTYQRNKKLREERERDSKLLLLGTASATASGGSMESISHQMARIDSLRHGGGRVGKQQPTAALAAHLLRDEAQDQLGDLGPSLGLKKSSSLESLQTMVQEIQMADEPRGPNALRTPRGRGRDEILRALVEQPPEGNQAKKHWLLEEGPASATNGATPVEMPDGGFVFVSRNSPFQSSLNDGKGAKLRVKKSGGLLRGIGHMFRFGKHRKDGIAPAVTNVSATTLPCPPETVGPDYSTIGGPSRSSPQTTGTAWINESNGSAVGGSAGHKYSSGGNPSSTKSATSVSTGAAAATTTHGGNTNSAAAAASRYILFDPNSVERSASSGVVYGHHQPPHYQPPPPPPPGTASGGTSIHHTDVFNHRYSHYVNYEELQQQISSQVLSSANSTIYSTLQRSSNDDGSQANGQQANDHDEAADETFGSYWHQKKKRMHPPNDRKLRQQLSSALSSSYSTTGSSSSDTDTCLLRLHQLQQLQQWQWLQRLQQLHELEHEQLVMLRNRQPRFNRSSSLPACENSAGAIHRSDSNWAGAAELDTDAEFTSVDHNGNTSSKSLYSNPHNLFSKTVEDGYNNNDDHQSATNCEQIIFCRRSATSSSPLSSDHVKTQVQMFQQRPVNGIMSSRRHHHYHSQRSTRNTPALGDIALLATAPQSQQQHHPPSHHHHTVSLHNQSHPQQQKYKSNRPTSCYYDSASGGYETISSIGTPQTGGSSSSSHRKSSASGNASASNHNTTANTLLSVSSSTNNGTAKNHGNNILAEDVNGCAGSGGVTASTDWLLHHHPGSSGGAGIGGGVTTGSMRNSRGPFVTQVKIQNQMPYQ